MVSFMKNPLRTSVLFSFVMLTMAWSETNITFVDSARHHEVNIGAQLQDSLVFVNLKNTPTHYDNSMSIRFFLDGHFTENFLFAARVNVNTDYTNRDIPEHNYNPEEGIPYNKQSDNKRTWDLFAAHASYQLEPVKLLAGFDYLELGPAKRNHVILRGETNPYRPWQDSSSRLQKPAPTPYFGYQFEIGPIQYTQYAAKLFEKKGENKYVHIHRLGLSLPENITLGLSETALYGTTTEAAGTNPNLDADSSGRDFEWAYAIPFIPYVFQEHLQGDQDNISLAFDLSIKSFRHWELYGELLWDDMKSPTSMFDDGWWGNKWATSVGIARDSLLLGPVLFRWVTEYTRIEPWVYTHHKGGGYTYAHYNQTLGSNLGPNSQEIYTELNAQLSFVDLTLFGSLVKKGTDFGSNIRDIHTPDSPTDKHFLKHGNTLYYQELGGSLKVTPWSFISVEAGYSRFFGDYEGFAARVAGSLQW